MSPLTIWLVFLLASYALLAVIPTPKKKGRVR